MIDGITPEHLREVAAAKILAKRDQVLAEQRQIKEEQARISARERELDRELAECRAAAKFFDINFEPPVQEAEIAELQARASMYRLRAAEMRSRGEDREASMSMARAHHFEIRARSLEAAKSAEIAQVPLPIPMPEKTVSPVQDTIAPTQKVSPLDAKMPKVRDIVLDQIQIAGERGQKTTPIKQYIEMTYSTKIHAKTVGMTLYRLSQEGIVHRKGQTWFFGPQVGQMPAVSTENPGVVAPGLSQTVVN